MVGCPTMPLKTNLFRRDEENTSKWRLCFNNTALIELLQKPIRVCYTTCDTFGQKRSQCMVSLMPRRRYLLRTHNVEDTVCFAALMVVPIFKVLLLLVLIVWLCHLHKKKTQFKSCILYSAVTAWKIYTTLKPSFFSSPFKLKWLPWQNSPSLKTTTLFSGTPCFEKKRFFFERNWIPPSCRFDMNGVWVDMH